MEACTIFAPSAASASSRDEVYHPIYHGAAVRSAARLPHATVLGDFSKALCLSGLRTGWIVERDRARRDRFTNARSYFTVSNTALGERLAALAIRQRDAIYGRARRVAGGESRAARSGDGGPCRRAALGPPRRRNDRLPLAGRRQRRPRVLPPHGAAWRPARARRLLRHARRISGIGFAASGEKFAAALERFESVLGGARRDHLIDGAICDCRGSEYSNS